MFKSGICLAFLISLIKFVVSISDENKAHVQAIFVGAGEKCVTEHPISEEDSAAFKDRRFPEGENAACFSTCVLTKIGLINEQGTLSPSTALERAKEILDSEDEIKLFQSFIDTCATEEDVKSEEKGCDLGKEVFKCFVDNAEKFGF